MNNTIKKLTIIITTYNSSQLIKSCIDSIINIPNIDIIIVDNYSSDNTIQIIETNFPNLKIIKNSKNLGFSFANNLALKIATTKYSLILNVDAKISQNDIFTTLKILEENPKIAIAGNIVHNCKLINGEITNPTPCPKNLLQLKGSQNDKFYINKFITGAGMYLNMDIMKKIGFFDEGFFLYCEDNEICKRAIKKGYNTAIIKNTTLIHVGGNSSSISPDELKKIYWHRFGWSKLYYCEKIYNKFFAKIKAIRMIINFSIKIIFEKIKSKKISLNNLQGLKGSIAYFIGKKAFDENNNPRG
jgi:hypothetical protein